MLQLQFTFYVGECNTSVSSSAYEVTEVSARYICKLAYVVCLFDLDKLVMLTKFSL